MSPAMNLEWWIWAAAATAILSVLFLFTQVRVQYRHELTRWGECGWLGCSHPATGGPFGGGRYCRPHLDYVSHGVSEPLT